MGGVPEEKKLGLSLFMERRLQGTASIAKGNAARRVNIAKGAVLDDGRFRFSPIVPDALRRVHDMNREKG
jgi:hypothetical protein